MLGKTWRDLRSSVLESKGTLRGKSLCNGKEPKKKLPEEEVQFQKNTEESGLVCKTFSGELETTRRNDLNE